MHVLGATGGAIQAGGVDLPCGRVLEHKNLGLVPAAIHVRFSRSVTPFTTMPFRPFPGVERGHKVRRIFVRLEETLGWHVLVACLTDFGAYVERGVGRTCVLGRFIVVAPGHGGSFGHQQKHDEDQGEEKAATRDHKVLLLAPHFVATVGPVPLGTRYFLDMTNTTSLAHKGLCNTTESSCCATPTYTHSELICWKGFSEDSHFEVGVTAALGEGLAGVLFLRRILSCLMTGPNVQKGAPAAQPFDKRSFA